uniref:Cytochrome P450 n=1 Tax=Megaselia scalaris TaxID=36166 RepID=T1GRR6_MEGSC
MPAALRISAWKPSESALLLIFCLYIAFRISSGGGHGASSLELKTSDVSFCFNINRGGWYQVRPASPLSAKFVLTGSFGGGDQVRYRLLLVPSTFEEYTFLAAYFEEIGIEYDKATPFLGTFKAPFLKREHFLDNLETIYKRFDSGIIGIFDLNKKAYMVRSPEVIRLITTKYFDHFTDRRGLFNDAEHSLLGNSLFQLRGKKWKDMRTSLSPAFTGSKLRGMFVLMRDISESTVEHLQCSSANEIELKDFLSRYANDVIATTAFGFQINSNKDPENYFFMTGKEIFNLNTFKLLFITSFSWLAKVLELDFLSKRQSEYYMKLVLEAMDLRKKQKIFRPDMINMLMEMREIGLEVDQRKWSDTELVAQCFSFFAAAFDTVSSTLSFICHELMENQDCQNKLRNEIFQSLELRMENM